MSGAGSPIPRPSRSARRNRLPAYRPRDSAALLVLGLIIVFCSCGVSDGSHFSSTDGGPAEPLASLSQRANASRPIALGGGGLAELMRRTHFSYRAVDGHSDRFEAAHATYSVEVATGSAAKVEITPYGYGAATQHAPGPRGGPRSIAPQAVRRGAPLALQTVDVLRGGEAVAVLESPAPRITDEGHLVLDYRGISERWSNDEEGVEQSFDFSSKPPHQGDLEVRIRIIGQRFVGVTDQGLHFRDEASALGFRYGLGTWIDAAGTTFEITPSFEDEHIVLRVPERIVDESDYPAVLDPVIGPEIAMDDPVVAPGPGEQGEPLIAFGTTKFLAVWPDKRNPLSNGGYYGAIIDNFTVRPAGSFRIGGQTGNVYGSADTGGASLTFDPGTKNFFLAWVDVRSGQNQIYGARISETTEAVVDTNGIAITGAGIDFGFYNKRVAVACDGTNFLTAWSQYRSGTNDIVGRRVSTAGTLVDTTTLLLRTGAGEQTNPALAWNSNASPTGYMLVYEDTAIDPAGNISANWVRFTPGLSVGANLVVSNANSVQARPAVAYMGTGSNNVVVWEDMRGVDGDIYAARMVSTGVVAADAAGKVISQASDSQYHPAVSAASGTAYITWTDARAGMDAEQIYGNRFEAGVVKNGDGVKLSNAANAAVNGDIACYPAQGYCTAVWAQREIAWDVFGAVMTYTDQRTPFVVGIAGNSEQMARVASDGTNFFVVWQDLRNTMTSGSDIFGVRVGPTGALLDGSAIPIATNSADQTEPDVAFLGNSYLVAWKDARNNNITGNDIYGTRVDTSGVVQSASGVPICTAISEQAGPRVTAGSTHWLVTWQDERAAAYNRDVYGARVSAAGLVVEGAATGIPIATQADYQWYSSATFDGADFLVTWLSGSSSSYQVRAARVIQSTGKVRTSDAGGIAINTTAGSKRSTSVDFDGTNYLVAWTNGNGDVYGTRVSRGVSPSFSLSALDGLTTGKLIASAGTWLATPSVSYDGYNFLVVWADNRASATRGLDIYGTWISPSFSLYSPTGLAISTTTGSNDSYPDAAFNKFGQGLVVYDRFAANDTNLNTNRVFARLARRASILGANCTGAAQCVSDLCSDGKCCDTACSGACDVCSASLGAATSGFCANAPSSYAGNPACAGYYCSGSSAACPTSCTSDSACKSGYYCASNGTCTPQKTQGASCNLSSNCKTAGCRVCGTAGGCVDGYCCNSACAGACDVCAASLGASANGTCTTAPAGYVGNPSCNPYVCAPPSTACPSTCASDAQCASTHYCDASSRCSERQTKGSECNTAQGANCKTAGCRVCNTAGGCVDGFCCDTTCGNSCDGCAGALTSGTNGTCLPKKAGQPGTPACNGGLACNGSLVTCPSLCATDSDCVDTSLYCDSVTKLCHPRKQAGESCSNLAECLSKFCVDDVCCDSACSNTCSACRKDLKQSGVDDGVCGASLAGTDPHGECNADPQTSCLLDGFCDGLGGCRKYPSGTSCGLNVCQGNTSSPKICDGAGQCLIGTDGTDCQTYACIDGQCVGGTCQSDAECEQNAYCDSPPDGSCVFKKPVGQACTGANQCGTGFCADGFCCNQACLGTCMACSSATKGGGADGDCGAIADGVDPNDECAATPQSGCKQDGMCNGSGACRLFAANTACGNAICIGGDAVPQVCNGTGACVNGTHQNCAPYQCAGGLCTQPCVADANCIPGYFCSDNQQCEPTRLAGEACDAAKECKTGFCVDGVCCDSACTNKCQACKAKLKTSDTGDGVCGPAAVGLDPHEDCAADSAASCDQDGACDGAGACRLYGTATECGTPACEGPMLFPKRCDGFGECNPSSSGQSCGQYLCKNGACPGSCATSAECADGFACDGGQCVAKAENGELCAGGDLCISGHCVDGYCCDGACEGQCEACDTAGNLGLCSAVGGVPHGERAGCAGSGQCAGTCDGASREACTFPGSAVACSGTCPGGVEESGSCDGQGACEVTDCADAGGSDAAQGNPPDASTSDAAELEGDSGTSAGAVSPSDEGGCSCRAAGHGDSRRPIAGGLLVLALVIRRRRRERS